MRGETMPQLKPRRKVKRKNKKPNYFLRIVLLIIVATVAVYFFLQSATFNVKYITVSGNRGLSNSDVLDLSGLKPGSNIFYINFSSALASLATNPLIAESQVLKKYPSGLEIHISERTAIALVPSQNGIMYVDKDGVAIKESRELTRLELPIITGIVIPAKALLGKSVVTADLSLGLDVVKQLDADLKKRIAEINVKNNYITIFLDDKSEVRIGEPERLKEKLTVFDSIIKEEKKRKNVKVLQYIDVSFEGAPVIKYKQDR